MGNFLNGFMKEGDGFLMFAGVHLLVHLGCDGTRLLQTDPRGDDAVDDDLRRLLRGLDAHDLGQRLGFNALVTDLVPQDFHFQQGFALKIHRRLAVEPGQGQRLHGETDDAFLLADEVAKGEFAAAVGQRDRRVFAQQGIGVAEIAAFDAQAQVLDGELLEAFEFGGEDGGQFVRGFRVVELAVGGARQLGHEVFVVGFAKAEAGGADELLFQPGDDDLFDRRRLGDAVVELAVAQEEEPAGGVLAGFGEFVTPEHPAAGEVRLAAVGDLVNEGADGLFVGNGLEWNDGLGFVIKDDEAELVAGAKVADGKFGGFAGVGERLTSHGTAAVEHDAEGGRTRARLADLPSLEADGQMHRPGLIGEDGGIVELEFSFHTRSFYQGRYDIR